MIYLGSDIKDIYVGSEKIVKGYVGSELVYEYFHVLPGAGSVLYSDLTFTLSNEDIDTTKTPIGVIYLFKNTNTFRAISINDANGGSTIQWTAAASASISCATNGAIDGKTATATIINTININYGAASNCLRYSNGNTNVGDWFMPSMYELKNYVAVDAVKSSLNKFGPPSWYDEYIWTTDQHSSKTNYAGVYNFYNGGTSTVTKNSKNYAVPCLDLTGYTLKYLGKSIPANCLCFTAEADSSSVTLNQEGTPTISKNLYYSLTGRDKNAYTCGTTISLNKGDKLYMWSDDSNALSENGALVYKKFAMTGAISASGDIQSLLNGSDTAPKYAFINLFRDCASLTSIKDLLFSPNTLNRGSYEYMFRGCTSLTTAPKLPAMNLGEYCYYYMFYGCTSLTTAPELPATTLVKNCYYYMFYGCSSLNYIKAMFITSPGSTSNVTTYWVDGVSSSGTFVKNIDATWSLTGVNGIPTGWVVKTTALPDNCLCFTAEADSSSVTLNQEGTPTITKALYYSLTGNDKTTYTCGTTISLSKGDKLYMWSDDTNALTESESIYKQFAVAGEISVSGDIMTLVNGGDATMKYDFTNLLRNCSAITSFDTSTWDLSKVSNMKWALQTCSGLTTLDTSTWKFTNLESICATFEHCTKLTTLTGCENWKFTNLTNIARAFNDCPALTTMDTSNWDLSKVTDMTAAFWNCGYLTPIDTSNWDLSNVIWMTNAFRDCGSLKSLNTTNWKLTKVDVMNACFMNNWSLTSLEGSGNWDMSNVTQLNGTFWNCTSLTSLDCSGWNMPKVWDLGNTFTQCGNLTNLILGNGWGKWNQSWTITLRLSDVGKWQNYQLTDATYNSILNMYDRKSNGLGDAILQFSPSHNIPDGFVDKMTAKGYTITLAD